MFKQICFALILALAVYADGEFDNKLQTFQDPDSTNVMYFKYVKPFVDDNSDPEYLKFNVEFNLESPLIGNKAVTAMCATFYGTTPNELQVLNYAWGIQFYCAFSGGCDNAPISTYFFWSSIIKQETTYWSQYFTDKSYTAYTRPDISNGTHFSSDIAHNRDDSYLSKIPYQNAPVAGTKCFINFDGSLPKDMLNQEIDLTQPGWKEIDFRFPEA